MNATNSTVADLLDRSTSIVVDEAGRERSVSAISQAGQELAARLASRGIEPGDRVAARMANGPAYLDLLAAATWGRFVIMAVNTRFADPLAQSIIERSGAKLTIHGSDDMFHRLLATEFDLSSIETSGYARFNSALDGIVERCDQRGVPLAGLYGMSEVQALFAFRGAPGRPVEERWRAAGELVSEHAQRRVVDDELQLQGPSLFEGYLADGGDEIDTELTASAFDGPWFKTGDLAIEDGPRSFEYVTRMGDVMRLGGFLVAPAEVEGVLMTLPAVDQAQVVAVGRESGARPVAFVILAPGCELDERQVIDHCAQTLAKFKCPVRVAALDAFPVTDGPNGVKIQRAKLRAMGEQLLRS